MGAGFKDLVTEARSGRDDLDLLSARELVGLMNEHDGSVAASVAGALDAVAVAVDAIAARLRSGGRLIYAGAGTSGRLALVDAVECGPTFNVPVDRVQAVLAGGPDAPTTSVEGAEDDAAAGAADIAGRDVEAGDAVVGVSASGRTPYVAGALSEARRRGALTAALSCQPGAEISALADHAIEVEVGPEVVAGSTRLKAGTAQKMVLNMLSTAAFVRLGRTFGDLMVDVRPQNDKLRARALRVIRLATGVDGAAAERALAASADEPAVAVVSLRSGLPVREARAALEATGGNVRRAIEDAAR